MSKPNHSDIRFTNLIYNENKYYFLFITEIKASGIAFFAKEALARIYRLNKDDIECITIVPDILEKYNFENIIVVNKTKENENKRKSNDLFMQDVSNSDHINNLVDMILIKQKELFIYMFESNQNMTLDQKDGVTIIGPNKEIVSKLSNKIILYEIFSTIVPMAPYQVAYGYAELSQKTKFLLESSENAGSVFISLEKSAAGANSLIANNLESVAQKFGKNEDDQFLITKFIPHVFDPTTLCVAINEDEIYVAGIADQIIDGTKFKGSSFPSRISSNAKNEIIRQTRLIGKEMARLGYRGIFGCDFIVTDKDEVLFIETNPRKQGTTMEFCCTLHCILPKDSPNLPEIEFYAVTQSKKAPNTVEPDFERKDIYWETYNYKLESTVKTHRGIAHRKDEIDIFEKIMANKIDKENMILEHIGENFIVNKGSFLARVVALGKNFNDITNGIAMGKKMIDSTIA